MPPTQKKSQSEPADEPVEAEKEPRTVEENFAMVTNIPAFPVDAISALGIHNGVVRIQFMRLNVDGKAVPTVELHLPVSQLKALSDTLTKTAR
jgi:hypothetical protein